MTTHNPSDGTPKAEGAWINPSISYVEPKRRQCTFCGRPIARQFWRATVTTEPADFCNPEHEQLYRDYWLPVYGGANGS